MKNIHFKKGFTLIELLIVITIIGILAVALLPSVLGAPARARDAARKADINNIIAALETYNSDKQTYPTGKICFGTAGASPGDDIIKGYFQGQKSPVDPQGPNAPSNLKDCGKGKYLYCPLKSPYNYVVASATEIKGDATGTLDALNALTCDGSDAAGPATSTALDDNQAYWVTK